MFKGTSLVVVETLNLPGSFAVSKPSTKWEAAFELLLLLVDEHQPE